MEPDIDILALVLSADPVEADPPVVQKSTRKPCSKCSGRGFISAYSHRERGRCFSCEGTGVKLSFAERKAQVGINVKSK